MGPPGIVIGEVDSEVTNDTFPTDFNIRRCFVARYTGEKRESIAQFDTHWKSVAEVFEFLFMEFHVIFR